MKQSIYNRLNKLAQQVVQQDVRRLQNVKQYLFQPLSWMYINAITNQINAAIFELSKGKKMAGRTVNLQYIILNPSIVTAFSGGLRSFALYTLSLWKYLSTDNETKKPYTSQQLKQLITSPEGLLAQLNALQFPDARSSFYKTKIINLLNNWNSAL